MSEIEQKLQQLRIRYKNEPQNRHIILEQVKILKLGDKYPKFVSVEDPFTKTVRR